MAEPATGWIGRDKIFAYGDVPGDPSFDLPAADPDLVPLVLPLWDAYRRLCDIV